MDGEGTRYVKDINGEIILYRGEGRQNITITQGAEVVVIHESNVGIFLNELKRLLNKEETIIQGLA
jgi:hypothetical protein